MHDVTLVFGRIGAAVHEAAIADGFDTGVVTGGDGVETEQVGALAEPIELQVSIAFDARIRRETLAVGTHVRLDDVGMEVVGEVEHEVIDA